MNARENTKREKHTRKQQLDMTPNDPSTMHPQNHKDQRQGKRFNKIERAPHQEEFLITNFNQKPSSIFSFLFLL